MWTDSEAYAQRLQALLLEIDASQEGSV
jgi:hypothetical protein